VLNSVKKKVSKAKMTFSETNMLNPSPPWTRDRPNPCLCFFRGRSKGMRNGKKIKRS
jgi:hypothetical protein